MCARPVGAYAVHREGRLSPWTPGWHPVVVREIRRSVTKNCEYGVMPGLSACKLAAAQAEVVREGVVYDIEVGTSHAGSLDCARAIAARVA